MYEEDPGLAETVRLVRKVIGDISYQDPLLTLAGGRKPDLTGNDTPSNQTHLGPNLTIPRLSLQSQQEKERVASGWRASDAARW